MTAQRPLQNQAGKSGLVSRGTTYADEMMIGADFRAELG
jgi:hypothetical protein